MLEVRAAGPLPPTRAVGNRRRPVHFLGSGGGYRAVASVPERLGFALGLLSSPTRSPQPKFMSFDKRAKPVVAERRFPTTAW